MTPSNVSRTPYEQGAADAYYRRKCRPERFADEDQRAQYVEGYDSLDTIDKKQWE